MDPSPHTCLLSIEAFDLKPLESCQNLCFKLILILNTSLLLGVNDIKRNLLVNLNVSDLVLIEII